MAMLCALLPAVTLAAGPKASGSVSVKDDLLPGSGGGAAMTAGSSRLSGSFGQGGPVFVIGSTQARGGYAGLGLVPPDPSGSPSAAQNQTVRTSSVSWLGLSWTSPGENGAAGSIQAGAFYDVRRATFPLTSQAAWDAASFRSTFSAAGPGLSPVSRLFAAEPGLTWYFGHTTVNSGGMRSERVNASAWAQGLRAITEDIAGAQILQGQTTGFLKIRLWVDQGASVDWRTLSVGKAGILPDQAVQNVGLYRDNNANGVFDGGDPLVTGSAVFSSSRATLSLLGASGETVATSTQAYFLAAAIQPDYLPVEGSTISLYLDGMPFGLEKGGERGPDRPGIKLDGEDDYVSLAYDASLNITSALTVECWVRSTAPVAGQRYLLDRESAGAGYELILNNGVPEFFPGGGAGNLSAVARVDDGAWHHVAGVYEGGGNQRVYVDGLLMNSRTAAGGLNNTGTGLNVGANDTGANAFPGELDEVRVSKAARYSSAFIAQRRFTPDADTVVLYHFGASDPAQTALDASANANHGTLQGGAGFHARSSAVAIADAVDVVYSSITDLSPGTLYRTQANAPMLAIKLWTGGDFATFNRLSLERTGTGADGDVAQAKVYLDDGDGVFEPGADQDLAGGQFFVGTKSTFDFVSAGKAQTLSASTKTYFAVWDVAGSAGVGSTLGLRIGATVEFLLEGSTDTISTAGFPAATALRTVYAADSNASAVLSTGTWLDVSSVPFSGAFGQGNVSYYRYKWNRTAVDSVTGSDTQWVAGNATMTATADGNDWWFHVRSYDSGGAQGAQQDLGPFWIDRSSPAGSGFAALSSTGGWLSEGQWTGVASGASARISAWDGGSGLKTSSGYTAEISTDAGQTWAAAPASLTGSDGTTSTQTLTASPLELIQSTNSQVCGGSGPCGATNQARFTVLDMLDKTLSAGPYAVLVDTTAPSQPSVTSLTPSDGETVSATASGTDALSGVAAWNFSASTASDFSGQLSSSNYQGSTSWSFAGLTPGDTWYVRAESRDQALNASAPSVALSTWVWGTVQVSTADLAPATVEQGAEAAFLRLTLKTSPGRSTVFRTLRVEKLGDAPDGDVSAVRLYEDTVADGSFDPGGDTLRANGSLSSGEVFLDLGGQAQTITGSGKTFFVVYEAAPQAAAGGTLGARLLSTSDAGVDYPYRASGPFPTDSGLATIGDGPNDLNVTPESIAPSIVQPGSADVGMLKLTAAAASGGVSVLKETVLYLDGSLPSNKVSAVKVWRDGNGNGTFEPGSDWLLSSGSDLFASGVSTVVFTASQSSRTVYDVPSARLFVSASLTADAAAGSTFTVRVATPTEFRLDTALDTVIFSTVPMVSGVSEVQIPNNLGVTLADQTPADLYQGLSYAVLRASLTVDAGQAKVNRVTVNRTGAGADSDITAVKVYLDAVTDGQGWDAVNDSLRGQAAFSGGSAAVDITTVTLNPGATSALFIVYEIAPSANPGNTLGAGMSNASYVRAASPYTTVAGNFPFSSSNGTVKATVNTLSAGPLNQAPGSLLQGATNVALLRLRVLSDKNPISWTSLAVERLGTLGDAGVSAVKLFRDENGNGTFQYGTDSLVTSGADAFSGGSAVLGFTSAQSVTSSYKDYFVAVDVNPSAAPGLSLGVRVDTTTAFGVNSPNQVSTGPPSFPFDSAAAPVAEYADTVYVTTASIAPSGADPGEANVPMMSLLLNTDVSDANWLSLKVDRGGAGTDADVKAVKVYYDVSALGTFDPAQPGNYLLVTSDTMTFGSQGTAGTVNLAFSPVQSLNAASKRYFVVLDISTNASPGNTVTARALDKTYFSVAAPNGMSDTSFESGAVAVSAPPRKLYVLSYDSAPASALQGAINVPMLSLSLWMEQYSAQVTGLTVARTGTGSDSDVGKARLYRDDGDGLLDPAFDSQLATAAFSGGYANLAFAAETVTTSTETWFLAFDVAQTAGAGGTVGASIGTPGSVSVGSPHSAASQGFPHQSGLTQISPTQSGIYVSFQDKAPASLSQEATAQLMLSLAMNTTANAALLTSIEVEPRGTAGGSDVARLRIYLDDGDSTFEPGADQELASLADPFAAGPAVAGLSPSQEIGVSARRYWVAVDMAQFADPSKTFGLAVASAASLSVVSPDYAVDAGFPMESSVVPIAKVPDTLNVLPAALLSQDAIQGSTVAAVRLQAWASRQQLTWTRLKVRKSGSLADSLVRAAVYKDDGDGSLDSGDVLIGTAAFSGGLATVIFSSAATVGTSTGTWFAALALDLNATVGATVGAALDDTGFFTVVSPDGVAASGLPLSTSLVSVLDAKTPTQPQVVLPDGAMYHSFESIRFTWNSTVAQGSITSAEYCVGTTAGGQQTLAWTGFSPGQSEVTISGLSLANGSTYYVSVRATSSFGYTSPTGTSGSRLVDFQEPAKPSITAQSGETAVIVNWTNVSGGPSGIKGYLVEYRRIESPVWRNAKTGATAPAGLAVAAAYKTAAVSDDDLVNPPYAAGGLENGTLFFRVRAVSGAGSVGDPSDPVKVQYGPLPQDGISDVSAYPNPFDSRKQDVNVVYTLSADASVEIKIFDVFGRKVNVLGFGAGSSGGLAGTNVVTWDGTDDSGRKVSMGAYIAVIRSGGAKVVHKIGVIH